MAIRVDRQIRSTKAPSVSVSTLSRRRLSARTEKETETQLTGKQAFQQMQKEGLIPEDAIYTGYNPDTGQISYKTAEAESMVQVGSVGYSARKVVEVDVSSMGFGPEQRYVGYGEVESDAFVAGLTGPEIFARLKKADTKGKEAVIPENAVYVGYDSETGILKYTIPSAYVGKEVPEVYVDTETYSSLSEDDQKLLKNLGVDAYNEQKGTNLVGYVLLDTGEYVSKESFDKLADDDQVALIELGIVKFNKQKTTEFSENTHELINYRDAEGNPQYVDKEWYDSLSHKEQVTLDSMGLEAWAEYWAGLMTGKAKLGLEAALETGAEESQRLFEKNNVQLSGGEWINRDYYEALPTEIQSKLNELGVEKYNKWVENISSLPTITENGQTYYDLEKISGDVILAARFKQYVDGGVKILSDYRSYKQVTEALAQLPTMQKANVSMTDFALAQNAALKAINEAKKQGVSAKDALKVGAETFEAQLTVYDMEKIVGNDKLEAIFSKYVDGGKRIIADYKERQALLDKLEPYVSLTTPTGYSEGFTGAQSYYATKEAVAGGMREEYDIAKFIRENPKFDTALLVSVLGFSQKAVDQAIKYNEVMAVFENPEYQYNGGPNLALALKRGAITKEDLLTAGFSGDDVEKASEIVAASEATVVAVPGEKTWESRRTGEVLTDAEYKAMLEEWNTKASELQKKGIIGYALYEKIGRNPADEWALTAESGRRVGIELATFLFPAARAAQPEYEIKDITPVEWGLTGINAALIAVGFAPGAILGSLAGEMAVVGISTAGAGLVSYETAKNWAKMTPAQRAMGVGGVILYSIPLLTSAVRGIRIGTVKIPTTEGEVVAYRGVSVAGRPILGRSGGRWVIGAREITIPEARLILEGYHAGTMLETKVFVNTKALKKANFSETQIDYLIDSLKARDLFAGKKSAFLSKEALMEPTKYIDADELAVFYKQIAKYNKDVKYIDLIYGGTTIKAQLAPELRNWRLIHDLDMHTTFNLKEAKAFVNETLRLLRELPGKRQYRISPKSPIRIEKLVKGQWEHMNDLKSDFIDPSLQGADEVPGTKLDVTGEYSYGRMVDEPAIILDYPGIGKFEIKTLSQSGVEKADTILRVRQTPEGTAFRPPPRGIASPGVPKDAADYYVILLTFEESGVLKAGTTEAWLRSWAKAMGYTKAQLNKVLPNLRKALVEVAQKTPSGLIGYRFTPSKSTKVSPNASPAISIRVPSSLSASVSASLAKRISTPVSLYSVASRLSPQVSVAVSKMLSASSGLISPSARASVLSGLSSTSPSPKSISPSTYPSVSVSPSLSVSPSRAVSPSPVLSPSKVSPSPVSPSVSGLTPAPTPPSPTPPTIPPVSPPSPPPPPVVILPSGQSHTLTKEELKGVAGWKQGFIYTVTWPPYGQNDVTYSRKPILGIPYFEGPESAYKSIIKRGGKLPERIGRDMGIMDVFIESGKGDKPKLIFRRDIKQKTKLTGRRVKTKKSRPKPQSGLSSIGLGGMRL